MLDWVAGPGFDQLLVQTVRSQYPAHEHDRFIAHLRGLLGLWVSDERVPACAPPDRPPAHGLTARHRSDLATLRKTSVFSELSPR